VTIDPNEHIESDPKVKTLPGALYFQKLGWSTSTVPSTSAFQRVLTRPQKREKDCYASLSYRFLANHVRSLLEGIKPMGGEHT
jgi:hypothetical protein